MRQLCLLLPKIKLQIPCIHWPEKQKPSSKSNKYYTKHMENEKVFGRLRETTHSVPFKNKENPES